MLKKTQNINDCFNLFSFVCRQFETLKFKHDDMNKSFFNCITQKMSFFQHFEDIISSSSHVLNHKINDRVLKDL